MDNIQIVTEYKRFEVNAIKSFMALEENTPQNMYVLVIGIAEINVINDTVTFIFDNMRDDSRHRVTIDAKTEAVISSVCL